MNSRERVFAHLDGRPVDRLPLMPIGASGFRALAALHVYAGGKESSGATTATGLAGETALRFRPTSLPVFFQLGWRIERFTVSSTPSSPEDVSTVILGAGVQL